MARVQTGLIVPPSGVATDPQAVLLDCITRIEYLSAAEDRDRVLNAILAYFGYVAYRRGDKDA